MSRYTGSEFKRSRSLGFSTTETGRELTRRPNRPGQHGADRRGKLSDYGTQLKEKQKVRFMYGVSERQFQKTFREASKLEGIQGMNFLKLLESRLDNLTYRIGFASTRRGARQLVNHGHVTVNGNKVDIPSYRVKVGDVITLREKSRSSTKFKDTLEQTASRTSPLWLEVNKEQFSAKVVRMPSIEDIDYEVAPHLIVELYSK